MLRNLTANLEKLLNGVTPSLTPDTLLVDVPGLDSLRLLQTIAWLEDHLGIELHSAALDRLQRIGDIVDAFLAAPSARPERQSG